MYYSKQKKIAQSPMGLGITARMALLLLGVSMLLTSQMQAQRLFQTTVAPQLNEEQQGYLRTIVDMPTVVDIEFIDVNLSVLQSESFLIPVYNQSYWVDKRRDGSDYGSARSWVGDMYDLDYGQVNIAYDAEMMVANIGVDDMLFSIHPLGGGVHVLATMDLDQEETCKATDDKDRIQMPEQPDVRKTFTDPDIIQNRASGEDGKATGDCKIRVLVAFTNAARLARANILLDILNEVNMANTGYNNSGALMQIELAVMYQTDYVEAGATLDDHLCRFRSTETVNVPIFSPCGGYMNEVHSLRSLWRADQCALITTGGGGLAYLTLSYDRQFSVTGIDNFNAFTFQHELAHNALCTHAVNQSEQAGSSPYAGYGNTSGCFRTVMAYQDACGTNPCSRQNIFSANLVDWSCGGLTRRRGTSNARNTDRLNLSRNTIRNYETTSANPTFSGSYSWNTREFVSFVGTSTVTYASASNEFIMQNNSEGHFRASNSVTLGTGFWAKAGSTFTAYLENCTASDPPAGDAAYYHEDDEEEYVSPVETSFKLAVFPNPFRANSTLVLDLEQDTDVEITLNDVLGKRIQLIQSEIHMVAGSYPFQINGNDLPGGMYFIQARINDRLETLKLIRQH